MNDIERALHRLLTSNERCQQLGETDSTLQAKLDARAELLAAMDEARAILAPPEADPDRFHDDWEPNWSGRAEPDWEFIVADRTEHYSSPPREP